MTDLSQMSEIFTNLWLLPIALPKAVSENLEKPNKTQNKTGGHLSKPKQKNPLRNSEFIQVRITSCLRNQDKVKRQEKKKHSSTLKTLISSKMS